MSDSSEAKDLIIKGINDTQFDAVKNLFSENKWDLNVVMHDSSNEEKPVLQDTQFHIPPNTERNKCLHCFCQPCITDITNKQEWWGLVQSEPKVENCGKRKRCYRKFWAMMSHRRVWDKPEYKEKRTLSLQLNRNKCVKVYREIMPDCVLSTVRFWYPNPDGCPYMGHKWC